MLLCGLGNLKLKSGELINCSFYNQLEMASTRISVLNMKTKCSLTVVLLASQLYSKPTLMTVCCCTITSKWITPKTGWFPMMEENS